MHHNISLINQSVEYNNYTTDRYLILCESCFWNATIFKSDKKQEQIINTCPICFNSSISQIPLTIDEAYEYSVRSKGGLELKIFKSNKSQVNVCI
jgi:hypothetical protein